MVLLPARFLLSTTLLLPIFIFWELHSLLVCAKILCFDKMNVSEMQ